MWIEGGGELRLNPGIHFTCRAALGVASICAIFESNFVLPGLQYHTDWRRLASLILGKDTK